MKPELQGYALSKNEEPRRDRSALSLDFSFSVLHNDWLGAFMGPNLTLICGRFIWRIIAPLTHTHNPHPPRKYSSERVLCSPAGENELNICYLFFGVAHN